MHHRTHLLRLGIATLALTLAAPLAPAMDEHKDKDKQSGQKDHSKKGDRYDDYRGEKALHLLRASQFWGTETTNKEGTALGEIENLAIDTNNAGHIPYVLLSVGGFMDLGDKQFAIPWQTLNIHGTNNNQVVIDIPRERFENAEGIDQDNWPPHANRDFLVRRKAMRDREGRTELAGAEERGQRRKMDKPNIVKLTDVLDKDARNTQGDDLGKFAELLIDRDEGRIAVAIIRHNATAGMGGTLYAVPWQLTKVDKDNQVRVQLTTNELKKAKQVSWDAWSSRNPEKWMQDVCEPYQDKLPKDHGQQHDRKKAKGDESKQQRDRY